MNRLFLICFFSVFLTYFSLNAEENVIGFWKTIDDKTGRAESMVAIYEYQGKYYGRIILTYDEKGGVVDTITHPITRAPGVKGNPYYSGMDIIWDMERVGTKYKDGNILDPQKGKVYDSQMWPSNGNLIVRGQFLFFGKNQEWIPAKENDFPQGFKKPDLTALVPKIPEVN